MMLQFLQGKTFGNQKVPEGWVIVTAGNPPEYNKSVREFDVVTLDRIKRIDVQPDLKCGKNMPMSRESIRLLSLIWSFAERISTEWRTQ